MIRRRRRIEDLEQLEVYVRKHAGVTRGEFEAELYNTDDGPEPNVLVPLKGIFTATTEHELLFHADDSEFSTTIDSRTVLSGAVRIISRHKIPPHPYER